MLSVVASVDGVFAVSDVFSGSFPDSSTSVSGFPEFVSVVVLEAPVVSVSAVGSSASVSFGSFSDSPASPTGCAVVPVSPEAPVSTAFGAESSELDVVATGWSIVSPFEVVSFVASTDGVVEASSVVSALPSSFEPVSLSVSPTFESFSSSPVVVTSGVFCSASSVPVSSVSFASFSWSSDVVSEASPVAPGVPSVAPEVSDTFPSDLSSFSAASGSVTSASGDSVEASPVPPGVTSEVPSSVVPVSAVAPGVATSETVPASTAGCVAVDPPSEAVDASFDSDASSDVAFVVPSCTSELFSCEFTKFESDEVDSPVSSVVVDTSSESDDGATDVFPVSAVVGLVATGASAFGSDTVGSSTFGAGDTGSSAFGSDTIGSSTFGAGDTGSSTFGSDTIGSSAFGAGVAGSSACGVVASGSSDFGVVASGSSAFGADASELGFETIG